MPRTIARTRSTKCHIRRAVSSRSTSVATSSRILFTTVSIASEHDRCALDPRAGNRRSAPRPNASMASRAATSAPSAANASAPVVGRAGGAAGVARERERRRSLAGDRPPQRCPEVPQEPQGSLEELGDGEGLTVGVGFARGAVVLPEARDPVLPCTVAVLAETDRARGPEGVGPALDRALGIGSARSSCA